MSTQSPAWDANSIESQLTHLYLSDQAPSPAGAPEWDADDINTQLDKLLLPPLITTALPTSADHQTGEVSFQDHDEDSDTPDVIISDLPQHRRRSSLPPTPPFSDHSSGSNTSTSPPPSSSDSFASRPSTPLAQDLSNHNDDPRPLILSPLSENFIHNFIQRPNNTQQIHIFWILFFGYGLLRVYTPCDPSNGLMVY
jgi:hypothetical protein